MSNTIIKVIEAAKYEDEDEYNHIYLGEPKTDDDRVIIKRSWIMSAIDAHKKLSIGTGGARRIGYDIADDGKDKNATVYVEGIVTLEIDQWQGVTDDLLGSCTRVYSNARKLQSDIYYDCIGVGASAGSKFKELNLNTRARIKYTPFRANGSIYKPDRDYEYGVINKDFFTNIKAQAWWTVADRFRNTHNAITKGQKFRDDELISISSDCKHIELLIDELSTPFKDFDSAGKVKVESKDDLAKRNVKSPNLAEAFIIAYSPIIEANIDYGLLL
ncbi:MAG: hypothetical protein JKY80_02095 [Mariprofundaceae bacterium]|nr:hypothetical protein [Mariprofundaceae bacterium]